VLDTRVIYKNKYKHEIFQKLKTTDLMKINGILWKTIPKSIKAKYRDLADYIKANPRDDLDWRAIEGRSAYKRLIGMPEGLEYIPMPQEEEILAAI